MYVYAGAAVRVLGHDARDERDAQGVQLVREAVDRYRVEAGVAEDYLVVAGGRGVALVRGLHVIREHPAHARELREELFGALGRLALCDGARVVNGVAVVYRAPYLLGQRLVEPRDARLDV